MAEHCAEEEVFYLQDLYGRARGQVLVPEIVRCRLKRTFADLQGRATESSKGLSKRIKSHVNLLVPHACRYAQLLDEEQERELEEEL
jgi:hypothetical protein